MFDLHDQIAIVTGAGQGIGEVIARRFARAGSHIAVADLNYEKARAVAESIGGAAFAVHVDVTDARSVERALQDILQRVGHVEILVNNAGYAGRAAPISEQTDDDWEKAIAINLTGVFNWCRAIVPHMRERGYGRIVNIASIAGKEGNPRMVPYSATKAGVIALTKSLGKELATEGICVNSVAPAVVQTQMLEQLTPQQVSYMTEKIPMGRTCTPEEVAAVVHFLSSRDCSFVTGQCYDVSGGRATY
jgi:3-oxoacyl-[acyl-carrier protein] reductase